MDFHEPDLEDLIQSDLHSEMNKILDQSDTGNCDSNNKTETKLPLPSLMLDGKSILQVNKPCKEIEMLPSKSDHCSAATDTSQDGRELNQKFSVEKSELTDGLLFDSCANKSEQFSDKLDLHQPMFSGHFSLEKLPANEESLKLEHCQIGVPENNDLSSLTWLTGVDVQQTLEENSSVSDTMTSGSVEVDLIQSQNVQDSPHTLSNNQTQNICSPINPQSDIRITTNQIPKKQPMKFTPIQPNVPYEDCQRYQLHQGDPIRVRMFSSDQRIGMHRSYHPYPPPPYGSAASYIPDSYRHNRLHNQGKKVFPKPVYSYSCLIAMSLRASKTGCLPVSDIYTFMMENYPYFKTAPDGWKNSVRHNLSLNKCFEKVEKPNGSQRKGCLWALNPAKITKMEEEVQKWKRKDPEAIRRSMSNPEELDRELEEIRRSDEEAARRRMLSMTPHGLSMLTPPPGFNPYARPPPPHHQHPNLHPSGTTSLPTTPHHYHQQQNPSRMSLVPGHGGPMSSPMDDLPHQSHPPRQLFNYPSEQQNYSYVASCPPSSGSEMASMRAHEAATHSGLFTSPYSTSSSSSGHTSLLGTLADTISKSEGDLNDIDLDSSLADLSAFQGSLWEDNDPGLLSHHPMVSEVDSFDDVITQRSVHPSMTSSTIEQCASSDKSIPDSSMFGASSHFMGDISYMNGNNKAVILH